jgi:hypothetical protein
MGEYEHRQYGWWWFPLLVIGISMPILPALVIRGDPGAQAMLWPMMITGFLVALAGLSFVYLDVRDDGERLAARFGPLPPCGTSVPYGEIESVERMRTSLLHGLGLHVFPGWFLVCNIRGADAVRIRLKRRRGLMKVKQIIIGTDDAEALLAFLQGKAGAVPA